MQTSDNRNVNGALVIVDEEKKTLAMYGVECCTQQLKDKPDCFCELL